jgi:ribonuclease BN (tRNA processing enzyme)
VRLTVVGCSGSFPGPRSTSSCYLLEHDGYNLVLDLGNGAFGELQRYVATSQVHAVALSHLHPDHCLDLCGMYVARRYDPSGALPRIPVWGPSGVAARLARAYDLPESPGMTAEFDFGEYESVPGSPPTIVLGPFAVTPYRVVHPVPAYALRISCGDSVLTYSGDTGPCDALVDAASGADLFLVEASFEPDRANPPDLHLTGIEAGEHAAAAGVRRVVGTHVPPWHDPQNAMAGIRSAFSGDVEMARPGARWTV